MIELLARRHCPELVPDIDFSTLCEVSTELVSDQLDRRYPDLLFVADSVGRIRKVLFHLEFQATIDSEMQLRCLYAVLAGRKLRKRFPELRRAGALAVVSMVLYHGSRPWKALAPVDELMPGVTRQVLIPPQAVDPDRMRAADIPPLVLGLFVSDQEYPALHGNLDAIERPPDPDAAPEVVEHIVRNLRLALGSSIDHSVLKETDPMATLREMWTRSAEADTARRARQEGRLEGRRAGRREGQARTIERLAARRFGLDTARHVSRLLAGVTDADRMDRVADAAVECDDGREFLQRVSALVLAEEA